MWEFQWGGGEAGSGRDGTGVVEAGLCGSGASTALQLPPGLFSLGQIPSPQAGSDLPAGAGEGRGSRTAPSRRETSSLASTQVSVTQSLAGFLAAFGLHLCCSPERAWCCLVCAVGGLRGDCTV